MAPPVGYDYYVDIAVSSTADVVNSVVTVDLSAAPSDFWSHLATVDGSDIYITDASDTKLDRWLDDNFSTVAETGTLHVRCDASAVGTTIRIYFGNAAGVETNSVTTWTGAGYIQRLSLQEATGNFIDSCGAYDSVPSNVSQGVAGKLGKCGEFNGNNSYCESTIAALANETSASVEMWLSQDVLAQTDYFFYASGSGPYLRIGCQSGTTQIRCYNNQATLGITYILDIGISAGEWFHFAYVVDSSLGAGNYEKLYKNGVRADDYQGGTEQTDFPDATLIRIGHTTNAWDGKIDEVRIASVSHSADFLAVAYNSQNSSSGYLVWGTVQSVTTSLESNILIEFDLYGELTEQISLEANISIDFDLYGDLSSASSLESDITLNFDLYGDLIDWPSLESSITLNFALYGNLTKYNLLEANILLNFDLSGTLRSLASIIIPSTFTRSVSVYSGTLVQLTLSAFQRQLKSDLEGSFYSTNEFAEVVEYTFVDGTVQQLNVIFDEESSVIDMVTEAGLMATAPMLHAASHVFQRRPEKGDSVKIRNRKFVVKESLPDGSGVTVLALVRR